MQTCSRTFVIEEVCQRGFENPFQRAGGALYRLVNLNPPCVILEHQFVTRRNGDFLRHVVRHCGLCQKPERQEGCSKQCWEAYQTGAHGKILSIEPSREGSVVAFCSRVIRPRGDRKEPSGRTPLTSAII